MSDAAPFDPTILDNKSKDELIAIASTLGPKPSARFKKAELIAHILDLVGGSAPETGGARTGADAGTADVSAGASDERAPSAAAVEQAADTGDVDGAEGSKAARAGRLAGRPGRQGGAGQPGGGSDRGDNSGSGSARPARAGGGGEGAGQQQRNDGGDRAGTTRGNQRSDSGDARTQSGATRSDGSEHKGAGGAAGQQDRNQGNDSGSDRGQRSEGGDRSGNDRNSQRNEGGDRSGSDRSQRSEGGDRSGNDRNQRNGGDGNRGNQNDAAGPGNQAEPSRDSEGDDEAGNRRRRRRGREREGGGEQAQPEPMSVEGMVDLRHEGYGFLRVNGFLPSRNDAYISVKQTRQFGLRTGDLVAGKARPANRNEKNPALLQVEQVNGHPSHTQPTRRSFEDLTPLFPDERLRLEMASEPANATVRIIDLVSPIGKGQRGLIVSPPKAGKTTIVKHVVRSIETNHPEVELMVLLVDERPEEVTDMKRWLLRGTVAASTFDRPAEEHITVAELVIERAKRLVEDGKDVVVVLDGITRLARAYNLAAPATGRIMAGGIDTGALYPPKKFFGAARNAEEGGSLTILATALVETNTRMDEVIFEEFKGTGNMELKLDRKLAERRIFPAIDVDASSTRHEELLFSRQQLPQVWKLRRVLGALRDETGSSASGVEMLTERLNAFKTNDAFLDEVAKTTGA